MSTLLELTGKEHISYSSFTTYLDCGEKFRLQRVFGIQGKPAYYLAGGTAVHVATETFDTLWVEHDRDWSESLSAAVDSFRNSFEGSLAQRAGEQWLAGGKKTAANPGGEDKTWWLSSGIRQVQQYAEWRRAFNARMPLWRTEGGVLAVELPVDPILPGEVQLKGYIDRVFTYGEDTVVVDIKTSTREPASHLQLGVYAIALEREYGVRPRYGSYFMTRKGELGNLFDLSSYREDILARHLRDFRKAVEAELFMPHPTMLCGSCNVREHCYAVSPSVDPRRDFDDDLNAG